MLSFFQTLIFVVQLVKSQLSPPAPDGATDESVQAALVEALLQDPRLELIRDELDPRLNPLLDARLASVRLANRPSYDPYGKTFEFMVFVTSRTLEGSVL